MISLSLGNGQRQSETVRHTIAAPAGQTGAVLWDGDVSEQYYAMNGRVKKMQVA